MLEQQLVLEQPTAAAGYGCGMGCSGTRHLQEMAARDMSAREMSATVYTAVPTHAGAGSQQQLVREIVPYVGTAAWRLTQTHGQQVASLGATPEEAPLHAGQLHAVQPHAVAPHRSTARGGPCDKVPQYEQRNRIRTRTPTRRRGLGFLGGGVATPGQL